MSEDREKLEKELSEMLSDVEEKSEKERLEETRKSLPHKYEIRVQTELDPIVEETLKYRSMAKEIDGRYDNYLKKAVRDDKGPE
ncbi:hypothetical protein [Paenibacillus lentus]|uniref:Uncharacterized protein n=1 Tax=Paenibacillus lentus TaxID=1338368 RepID=A0A3Q8S3A8_9BACL|nr:hypothetical protein [Paenibacillus lentus]AZK44815.1 hypothetical protein EIM92_00235 [Paenibacillus lentus]